MGNKDFEKSTYNINTPTSYVPCVSLENGVPTELHLRDELDLLNVDIIFDSSSGDLKADLKVQRMDIPV